MQHRSFKKQNIFFLKLKGLKQLQGIKNDTNAISKSAEVISSWDMAEDAFFPHPLSSGSAPVHHLHTWKSILTVLQTQISYVICPYI